MGQKSLVDRFFKNVDILEGDECWHWKGYRGSQRYGFIRKDGKKQTAHRVSYILFFGDIPDGVSVLHKCDNGFCVNPDHLFLGTQKDNMKDASNKRRIIHSLSDFDVIKMRRLYETNEYTQRELAIMFGVTQPNVFYVVNYFTWV